MNPAALARYTNPGAELGHAGPSAPVHADPRLDFVADLPRLADSPQAAADGFRANLPQKDAEQLARTNRLLRESLADVLKVAGRAARTPADDQVIERATRVLTLGGLLA
jgi:hypothetical protein